jgi:uncharacterized SAM-binding protein YcdF (DUF218 family)
MRADLTELFHALVQLPFWVFLVLAATAVRAWRSPKGTRRHRWRLAWIAAALAFYALSIPLSHVTLERWLEHRYPVPAVREADRSDENVILVLTAGWLRRTEDGHDLKIGEAGWERTAAAVALWRRIGGRLVFTGAPTPDRRDSAAAAMARLARGLGVPEANVLVEPASLNTHENMLFSRRMLGESPRRLWLVTSALHMPRSVLAAKAVGFEVVPYPCDFRADEGFDWSMLLPGSMSQPAFERALHELVGMAAYRLRGWS